MRHAGGIQLAQDFAALPQNSNLTRMRWGHYNTGNVASRPLMPAPTFGMRNAALRMRPRLMAGLAPVASDERVGRSYLLGFR